MKSNFAILAVPSRTLTCNELLFVDELRFGIGIVGQSCSADPLRIASSQIFTIDVNGDGEMAKTKLKLCLLVGWSDGNSNVSKNMIQSLLATYWLVWCWTSSDKLEHKHSSYVGLSLHG